MLNTKSYFFAKCNGGHLFNQFLAKVSMRAHAEENPPAPAPAPVAPETTPPPAMDIEALLARVRKEEKDKLYGRIQKLETEVSDSKKKIESYILQIGSYQQELEKLRNQPDKSKELTDKIAQLEHDLEEAKKSTVDEATLRSQIEAEYEVKSYLKDKLTENKDNILATFVKDVTGKTKEEVDAAIQTAIESTTQIKKDLGLIDDKGNPVGKPKSKPHASTPAPAAPPVSAPASPDEETFDPEYVRNLDPRSKEYAEFRKKMGLR